MGDEDDSKLDGKKVYKIKYSLNLLPILGAYIHKDINVYNQKVSLQLKNDDINILEQCAESDEIEMFNSVPLQDLIEFKWSKFAWQLHFFGCCIHFIYIFLLFSYSYLVYI